MFLKTLHFLWRRIFMGDQYITHVFLDKCFVQPRRVEDWANTLTCHSDVRVHKDCFITSISFYKYPNGAGHEYLQFTVTMKKEEGGFQQATFETHRRANIAGEVNAPLTFGTSTAYAAKAAMNGTKSLPPAVQGAAQGSITSSALMLGTVPADDSVRPWTPLDGQTDCDEGKCRVKKSDRNKCDVHPQRLITEKYELGTLPLVPFALVLKSVSSYGGYRLLKTQCYWYAYTVYVLAVLYSGRPRDSTDLAEATGTPPGPERFEEIFNIAERLAAEEGLVFPKNVGRYGIIPIPRDSNNARVWLTFEGALKDYTTSNLFVTCMQQDKQIKEQAVHITQQAVHITQQAVHIKQQAAKIEELEVNMKAQEQAKQAEIDEAKAREQAKQAEIDEAKAREQAKQAEIEELKSQLRIHKPDV